MKKLFLIFLIVPFWPVLSQQNPKLDKLLVTQDAQKPTEAKKSYRTAEKLYKKGEGSRVEALPYYLGLYDSASEIPALNYKIGICYLESTRPDKAVAFFQKCPPEVTRDYYLQLGKSYMYALDYASASLSFDKYKQTLSNAKAKRFEPYYLQLHNECEFGKFAVTDSLPYFVTNLGPAVNSMYHDYSAINISEADTIIYFTTRRPIDEPTRVKPQYKYPERILSVKIAQGKPEQLAIEPKVFQTARHASIAGVNEKDKQLFYYLGKHQSGNIYSATIENGKYKKVGPLRGRVNELMYKETSFTIDSAGNAYFVSDKDGGLGGKDIYCCKKVGNRYKKVKNLGQQINTRFDEEGVYVTQDGKNLFFSSNGLPGMGGFDVYQCTKQEDGKWSAPVNMGYPVNSPANELFYKPNNTLLEAYLATTRPDAIGGLDIYKIKKDTRIPFELSGIVSHDQTGAPLNGIVAIYETESRKLVSSTTTDSLAGKYTISFEDKGSYTAQVDVPGYKSASTTVPTPIKRYDKLTLDFSLEKLKYPITLNGTITNAMTQQPIAAQINFRGADSDSILHMAFSDAITGNYSITFEDKANFVMEVISDGYIAAKEVLLLKNYELDNATANLQLSPVNTGYSINGTVNDKDTHLPIKALITVFSAVNDSALASVKADSISGKYNIVFDGKGPFSLEASAEGYFFSSDKVEFKPDTFTVSKDIELQKMKQGVKIVIENILFNTGKSTLLPQSFKELDKLAALLIENPTVRIEVSGHTDNVGSAVSNKKLSKARALSVKNYLHSKGVPQNNVEYEGYGSEQPVADNKTAQGKAQNRRVEVKVLEQ